MHSGVHHALATTWKRESARIVAAAARRVHDLGVAEEVAQDALVAALEHWPRDGIPDNPAAWLMTTALNRALDHLRRLKTAAAGQAAVAQDLQALQADRAPDVAEAVAVAQADPVGDDLLRLIFTACHPVLPTDARVALTLRLVAGLTTHEIARAFLVPEATVAQRIVRAQKKLRDAQVPFDLPPRAALGERLAAVLEVVYLVFNEGYTATGGDQWMRPALCAEALRLAHLLATLAPDEPEVHGLLALLELQASRTAARTGAGGEPVLLADQDRTRWDHAAIARGLAALARAEARSGAPAAAPGPYQLQAAIAACHARASAAEATDWAAIARLYGELAQVAPSPVVELNRAVAVAMCDGPAAGLDLVDRLADLPALARYPWLPAVRGDLLSRLGRHHEARTAFLRAAELTENAQERTLMTARAEAGGRAIR
ncbi:MAG: sigma-70 family RNA polymerase sigma factor [Burkholderiaceae bacterium]|nr:sigma-70 family RNA polymerase sigma factor [Burkholderiaceae bacterium]